MLSDDGRARKRWLHKPGCNSLMEVHPVCAEMSESICFLCTRPIFERTKVNDLDQVVTSLNCLLLKDGLGINAVLIHGLQRLRHACKSLLRCISKPTGSSRLDGNCQCRKYIASKTWERQSSSKSKSQSAPLQTRDFRYRTRLSW